MNADPRPDPGQSPIHRRRPRYSGKYPRHFSEKYKEQNSDRYTETASKILGSGKTLAGSHRPILVDEILAVLDPRPGETVVDCTLGHGGHAEQILARLSPGGKLIGIDTDPIELPKTEKRLRSLGFENNVLSLHRSNYAGIPQILASNGLASVDGILADLGVSSMQLDDPGRGFSLREDGPLDMRMNPLKGQSASLWLQRVEKNTLTRILEANSDEPHAKELSQALAGKSIPTTLQLKRAIQSALEKRLGRDEILLSMRRVFQAIRIEVNEEFTALETLLRLLPSILRSSGRVAVLTFHSGEDRRVKKAFEEGYRRGDYIEIAKEVTRSSAEERRANPRSASAKLRWAKRATF